MEDDNSKYYSLSAKQIMNTNPEFWNLVNDYIDDSEVSWKGKFFLYENKIDKVPTCHCGNAVKFMDMVNGFKESCSRKCVYNSPSVKNKRKETNIAKYGVDNASKSLIAKDKAKKTNLERYGVEYTSQAKEVQDKRIENNLEKHSVEHTSQLDSVKDKAKKTNLEKYGVENPMQSPDVIEKTRLTNLERYGVDWSTQSQEAIEKKKATNLERYGTPESLSNPEIRKKIKQTNLERYGSAFPTQNKEVMGKTKKTNQDRHGVDWVLQAEPVKDKIKQTNKNRYGAENVSNSKVIQSKKALTNFNKAAQSLNDHRYTLLKLVKQEYTILCNECKDSFNILWQLRDSRIKQEQVVCTNCNPVNYNSSLGEDSLHDYIKSIYTGEIIRRFRMDMEIDIYLPELKIGFEHNGIYWHSEMMKPETYHFDKMQYFLDRGIQVYQFWEDDWIDRRDIVKSMINNAIGLSSKIYARNCTIKEIKDNALVNSFLMENHIQGFVGSKVKLGLFHQDKLVSLMTFGAKRRATGHKHKEGEWELIRFCNKKYTTVVGGASRLFKFFIGNYEYDEIFTFSHNTHSIGKLYENLNFDYSGNTKVSYFWGKGYNRYNRYNYRKDQLVREGYDKNKTEVEIMHERNFFRIYDAGSKRWIYEKIKKHP